MKKRITTEIAENRERHREYIHFSSATLFKSVRSVVYIFSFLLFSFSAMAQDTVTMQLAEDHVDITTGFTGATLSVFGVKNGDGEVAITVMGPRHDMTVRRKENIFGAWMNRVGLTFENVPVYYNYATSAPEKELAPDAMLRGYNVGLSSIEPKSNSWFSEGLQKEFRDALVRNKQQQGLYAKDAKPVVKISDNFFRANFYLPANMRTGEYEVKAIYFKDKKVADVKVANLRVAHVGTAANILSFERDHAFAYALLCIVLGLFAGWLSNRIRRRA